MSCRYLLSALLCLSGYLITNSISVANAAQNQTAAAASRPAEASIQALALMSGPEPVGAFSDSLALKHTCDRRETIVRIRSVKLCRLVGHAQAASLPRTAGVIRFRLLAEDGLAAQLVETFAATVGPILAEEAAWSENGVRFERVDEGYDFTILLAQPRSVDLLCRPLRTGGWLSCAMGRHAILNAVRWREGSRTWGGDVAGYHRYLVKHEVGHVLGLHHVGCPEGGAPAPIMLPQTKLLDGCAANGNATEQDVAMIRRIAPNLQRRFSGAVTITKVRVRKRARVRREVRRKVRRRSARYRYASWRRPKRR